MSSISLKLSICKSALSPTFRRSIRSSTQIVRIQTDETCQEDISSLTRAFLRSATSARRLAGIEHLMVSRSLLSVRLVSSTYAWLSVLEFECPPSLPGSRAAMVRPALWSLDRGKFKHAHRYALYKDLGSKKRRHIVLDQV